MGPDPGNRKSQARGGYRETGLRGLAWGTPLDPHRNRTFAMPLPLAFYLVMRPGGA